MRFIFITLLFSISLFAQFPPGPGGGGPKPPNIKKPQLPKMYITFQVQKVLSLNMKQMMNLDKQFAGMKKKLLEGNKKQLTQFLSMA